MGSLVEGMPGDAGNVLPPDDQGSVAHRVDGTLGPVRLRYFAPPRHLSAYFGSLYLFTVNARQYSDVTRADLAQLRLLLDGGGNYLFQDGFTAPSPDISLLGPTFGATRFVMAGPVSVIGVSLLPAGWLSLQDGAANELADRCRDLGGDGEYDALLTRLRGMTDTEAMAALCWSFLGERIRPIRPQVWTLLHAMDAWLMGDGSPRIDRLVEATELSPRQLARLSNRYYGAAPKLLARKYRALRCSARLALDGHSWQQLCEDAGFYDQSHLIREIKHFVGLTPHQLQNEPSAVAQLTLMRRSLGGDLAVLNRYS